MSDDELLSIGEFARRTRLTPKALRIYDRIDLLRPRQVDEDSGYRRYSAAQIRAGQLIALMRAADLGLEQIGGVLSAAKRAPVFAAARLDAILAQSARRAADRGLLIRHIQATLREGDDPVFTIETRHVPARRVMSMQRRLHGDETDAFARHAKAVFAEHLAGAAPAGPFTLIFHGEVNAESDGPLEAILGCPEHIAPSDEVGIRMEPAHDEAYTPITKAQWAYPAILAAYDAVACSEPVRARGGSGLSCREVYRAEPDDVADDGLVCDVAFPLATR